MDWIRTWRPAIGLVLPLLVALSLIIVALPGCEEPPAGGTRPAATQTSRTLSADVKAAVMASIKAYPEVRDAAVSQKGDQLSLVLIVGFATNTQRAKTLGENFVRLTKSLGPDRSPGKEIGKGIFDYVIGVYYPDESQVVLGAKSRTAERISW